MHILFVCPSVSSAYTEHVENIAQKGWRNARYLKRDIRRHDRFARRVFYGLGLLTLASGLPQEYQWAFVDENLETRDLKQLYDRTRWDIAALTGQVIQGGRTMELIRYFVDRGIHVAVGGAHATGFWEDYRQEGVSVFLGEGERLFGDFLDDFSSGRPKPVYRQQTDSCVDLDASPVPIFSAVSHYPYSLIGVQTTRGCPYRCRYCSVSTMLGEAYRHKPVAQVLEEIERVKAVWPESMFYFYDDNLLSDRDYAFRLFDALGRVKLGRWGVHADISISQEPDLLDVICSNGRPFLAIGFETLSEKNAPMLGNRMKAALLKQYDEGVTRLRRKGIDVAGSFMFGFPGDTRDELDRITAFIRKHDIRAYITRYAVIPGSPLYDEILSEYESMHGPMAETGTRRARILNTHFAARNGFQAWETENMIIGAFKASYTDTLPMEQIDALAVFRCFFS